MSNLKTLNLLADRVSHSMRTPLGVLVGLVEDLRCGYAPEEIEIEDSKAALKKILSIIELLQRFGVGHTLSLRKFNPNQLLDSLFQEIPMRYSLAAAVVDSVCGDSDTIKIALSSIIDFISAQFCVDTLLAGCRLTSDGCQFFLAVNVSDDFVLGVGQALTLVELAERNHSVQSLMLLLASVVADAHGGTAMITTATSASVEFQLTLPQQV